MPAEIDVYVLALVPALLWGFSPIVSKKGMESGGNPLQASLVVVVVDSLVYWSFLLGFEGVNVFDGLELETLGIFFFAGLVGTALGRLATFAGIERVGASINSAGISTRPFFATLLAFFWLGEELTLQIFVGVLVLVTGLVFLTLSKGGDITGWKKKHIVFPVLAAVFFAVGNVVRRFGLTTTQTTPLEAVTLNETAAIFGLFGYLVVTQGMESAQVLRSSRRSYGFFAVSGLITSVALISLFEALDRGRVAVVDPLSGTAPLFTTFFAYFLLRDIERVTRGVIIGASLIVSGVVLITGPQIFTL